MEEFEVVLDREDLKNKNCKFFIYEKTNRVLRRLTDENKKFLGDYKTNLKTNEVLIMDVYNNKNYVYSLWTD